MKILVVEDDIAISKLLVNILENESYNVDLAVDGEEGIYYALNEEYDLIILDIMMPKKNGYEVIEKLRQENISTPTLMLTAKNEVDDRVLGLDLGADDYMAKPFELKEFLARVRALTRRVGAVILDEIEVVDLKLNLNTYILSCANKSTTLSKNEFEVMKLLMSNFNQVFSKEQLIIKVWGYDSEIDFNNVEAYISFLRKKLKFIESSVEITTKRRIGYVLEVVNV